MDSILIKGGATLSGAIPISGAKNAALPLMAASLLTSETLTLTNLPRLADIETLAAVLRELGVESTFGNGSRQENGEPGGRRITLTSDTKCATTAPYELVRRMRASILVLGPLLTRFGHARVSLPGGCAIGTRPVDLHVEGLRRMGAEVTLEDGYIEATAPKGLQGAVIHFSTVSVGATENLMMAATLARGETVIENAAREPEVADLARCLVAMGARIEGIGSERLLIQGATGLGGATYRIMPDRIETGSYAVAAAIAGGRITLLGARLDLIGAVAETLHRAGVSVEETAEGLQVRRERDALVGFDLTTQPYPGFPTDMQAQMMVLASVAEGASRITETIFENRFMHVPELARMGADITVHGGSALVRGVARLTGAPVMATDLRASVSLILAGLVAEGETVVNRVYHLDRGYEAIERKLAGCGARIERITGDS